MPAGISQSIVTPGALMLRSAPETGQMQPRRGAEASATVENPQAVLAARSDELVRAPDPGTGGQRPENRPAARAAAATGSRRREPAGNPGASQILAAAYDSQAQVLRAEAAGGTIDMMV